MTRSNKREYDLSLRFGRVSGPVCALLAAITVAVAGRVFHLPGWLPCLPTLLAIAATGGVGWRLKTPVVVVAYRASCWAAPGAWASWVVARGPSWLAVAALAG